MLTYGMEQRPPAKTPIEVENHNFHRKTIDWPDFLKEANRIPELLEGKFCRKPHVHGDGFPFLH